MDQLSPENFILAKSYTFEIAYDINLCCTVRKYKRYLIYILCMYVHFNGIDFVCLCDLLYEIILDSLS